MDAAAESPPLPTELRTERLILRVADVTSDADCDKLNSVRWNASGGTRNNAKATIEGRQAFRYKNRVHGPRQDLCTLAPAPASILWLMWLPAKKNGQGNEANGEQEDLANLVGYITMSFRPEMPMPDMGYITVDAHAGHGYAAEAGRQMLHYWRDFVGVREIFAGCLVENVKSQRCAEKIGFVKGGKVMCEMADGMKEAVAYVLPGMSWKEGQVARPMKGWGPEE